MRTNKKDICVIGIGRYGQAVVEKLVELKKYVFALDINEKNLERVASIANQVAVVDGGDITGLKGLGIQRFSIVIVAVRDNITIVASLLELGVKHLIVKAENLRQERVLKQIGVDIIIKPEVEAGAKTALIAANNEFIKYSKSIDEIGDNYSILSTLIKNEEWTKIRLSKLPFSQKGVNIISIKRNGKIFIPTAQLQLLPNDLITIIGKNKNLIKILNILGQNN